MTTVVTTHIPIRPRSRRRRRDPIMHTVIREHDSRFQSVRRTAATETVRNSKRCRVQSSLRSAVSRRPAPSVLPCYCCPTPSHESEAFFRPMPLVLTQLSTLWFSRCSDLPHHAPRQQPAASQPALLLPWSQCAIVSMQRRRPICRRCSVPRSCWRRGCVSDSASPASAPATAPLPRARGR